MKKKVKSKKRKIMWGVHYLDKGSGEPGIYACLSRKDALKNAHFFCFGVAVKLTVEEL